MERRRRRSLQPRKTDRQVVGGGIRKDCSSDKSHNITLRRSSSRGGQTNSVLACGMIRFRYHRERMALIFLVGVTTLSLIYLANHSTKHEFNFGQPITSLDTDAKVRDYNPQNLSSHEERSKETAKEDPKHRKEMDDNHFTSAKTSTYQLLNEPIHGGFLHIHIQAKDEEEYPRTTGGDFWFATLSSQGSINPPRPKASTSGKVIDHHNGTYSVYFYLGWIGKAEINITLVHSNDAIRFLKNTYWVKDGKTIWNGHFVEDLEEKRNSTKPAKETISECTVRRNGQHKDECEYWFPQAMGQTVFVCHKPHPEVKCTSLNGITHNFDASTRVTREIAGDALKMFAGTKFATRLKNGNQTIELLPGNIASLGVTKNIISSRSLCKQDNIRKEITSPRLSDGFWYNGNWTSFICQATHWRNPNQIGNCLRNRELILSGDSILRQWAAYVTNVLHGIPIRMFEKLFKTHRYFPVYNFTLNFAFHPQVQTEISQSFNDVLYTVQMLDDRLRQHCDNDIVVISPWAHFLQWTRESYQEKMLLIQQAIKRYLHKCPKSPVVIKGPHARHSRTLEERLSGSNYTAFEWGEVMRATFADSGAWYMDVWDMNLSYGSKIDVHMPEAVVRQEVDMLLSYVCHNWT